MAKKYRAQITGFHPDFPVNPGPKDIQLAEPAAVPGRSAVWQLQVYESSVGEWYGWAHGPGIFGTRGEALAAARQVTLRHNWKTRVALVADPDPEAVPAERCHFCEKPVPADPDVAIDEAWWPIGWPAGQSPVGPICIDCLDKHCVQDEEGGWSVKAGHPVA